MNTALWVAQIFTAVVFLATGATKVVVPREKLSPHMHWAEEWPRGRIKLLGLAEIAGAVGLVVPGATSITPMLTPIAAVCLAGLMAGAVRTHQRLRESVVPPLIPGLLCLMIAAGRFHGVL